LVEQLAELLAGLVARDRYRISLGRLEGVGDAGDVGVVDPELLLRGARGQCASGGPQLAEDLSRRSSP